MEEEEDGVLVLWRSNKTPPPPPPLPPLTSFSLYSLLETTVPGEEGERAVRACCFVTPLGNRPNHEAHAKRLDARVWGGGGVRVRGRGG